MKQAIRLLWITIMIVIMGQESIPVAYGEIRMDNIERLPEWEMKSSSLGGTLLLSDSPEMVESDGVLYQDKVEGSVRLFFIM